MSALCREYMVTTPKSIPVLVTTRHTINRTSRAKYNNLRPVHRHEPHTTESPPNNTLYMALLNVRSLLNKSFLINDLIVDNNIHCMFLTETWLDTDGPASLIEASQHPNFLYSL